MGQDFLDRRYDSLSKSEKEAKKEGEGKERKSKL